MPKAKRGYGRETTSLDGGVREVRWYRASDAEYAYIQALAVEYGFTKTTKDGVTTPNVSALILDCLLVDMPRTREIESEMESKGIVGNAGEGMR